MRTYLHIASLSANKGISLLRDVSNRDFSLILSVIGFIDHAANDVLTGVDVVVKDDTLIALAHAVREKLAEILPHASNSEGGLRYDILGQSVRLYPKRYVMDSDIRFLSTLLSLVEQTAKNHDLLYLLDFNQIERQDGTGAILAILRKHNNTMEVNALHEALNQTRRRLLVDCDTITREQLAEAVEYFKGLGIVMEIAGVITLTSKGKVLVLN